MGFLKKSTSAFILVFGFISLFQVMGCEDNDSEEEEHTDSEGFILESSSGTEIYREFKGSQSGSISLITGDTLELSVHFLGDDGKELEHKEGEEEGEGELVISGFNLSIASFEVEDDDEMSMEIIGVSIGSTSFKLKLMHEEHADYTSTNNVPVVIK